MSNPPVRCRHCGHVFYSEAFGHEGADLVVLGNYESCPRCGGLAEVADGIYDMTGDQPVLVAGPASSKIIMDKLKAIAERAREDKLSVEDIIAEVAGVSPELSKKLSRAKLPAFLLILILFWLVKSISLNITVDINKLIEQAYDVTQGVEPDADAIPEPDFEKAGPAPIDEPSWPIRSTIVEARPSTGPNRQARRRQAARARKRTSTP